MAKNEIKMEREALILLECLYATEAKVAEKYGITTKTIQNYRKKLYEDEKFSAFFHLKKAALEKDWLKSLPKAVIAGAELIFRSAATEDELTLRNPEFVRAIAGAIKICSDVILTGEMINARIAKFIGDDQPQDGKGSASGVQESNHYTH